MGWVGKAEGWNDGGKKNGRQCVHVLLELVVLDDGDKAIVR